MSTITKISDKQIQAAIERTVRMEVQREVQAQIKHFTALASIPYASAREQASILRSLNRLSAKDREIVSVHHVMI